MSEERENVTISVNGETHLVKDKDAVLLDVLRDELDLTGAKQACDDGECGSCFVLLGDKAVMACSIDAARCQKKKITTIEGLSEGRILHALQQSFLDNGATQCGFCIPGMIMRSEALLRTNPQPTRQEIVNSLSRNLCRCTGYMKIFDAVEQAGAMLRDEHVRSNSDTPPNRGIGNSVKRLDTPGSVTGETRYAADIKMPDMLHGKILRSPHPHANIVSIDVSAAQAMEGVEAVVTAKDIPGSPYMSNCQPQMLLFADGKVRFQGEAVAAVAATTKKIAEAALAKIAVEYDVLDPVLSIEDAEADGAPQLHEGASNVSQPLEQIVGDTEDGFREADIIVSDTFRTARRDHAPMEPDAALSYFDDNGTLVVKAPLYHPFIQGRESIAATLDMDVARVRVLCPPMGGNFGKRGDAQAATVSALLTTITRKPVSVVLTRAESLQSSSKTPGTIMSYRIGARKDGRIVAMETTIRRNMGSWSPFLSDVTSKGLELCSYESLASTMNHVTGPYEVPNVTARIFDVLTNGPRGVPLRGTSGGYLPFAVETLMDRIAQELDIDPIELRLRNALKVGSRTHMGQVLKDSVGLTSELNAVRSHYDAAREQQRLKVPDEESPWRSGVGFGCGWRSITYVKMPNVTSGVELLEDGRVEGLAGSVEQGQGVTTQFGQIVSEALNIPMDMVAVTIGDTERAPYPVPTFSSVTTLVTGRSLLNAAQNLAKALRELAASELGCAPDEVILEDGQAFTKESPDRNIGFVELGRMLDEKGLPRRYEGAYEWNGDPAVMAEKGPDFVPDVVYGYNAAVAEVEVNTKTGQVRIPRLINAADPGTIINPLALEGQIHGGLAFGIGIALSEGYRHDEAPNLRNYGLPESRQVADHVVSICVDDLCEEGPFGAKSVAEMSVIAPVPAILNAISDAIGVRIHTLPARKDVIMSALENLGRDATGPTTTDEQVATI